MTLPSNPKNIATPEIHILISLANPAIALSVTEEIYDLLGYDAQDFMTGKVSFTNRIHADDQDIADAVFAKNITPVAGHFNIRLRQANGRIRCCTGSFSKIQEPITNNLSVELRLQDAKSLRQNLKLPSMMPNFVAMMENTDDYIYFKDRNHFFTGASQTLVAITDPSEHWTDLLGQTDYDVFPEEYADVYYSL
jgi:hypothetical protein